MNAYTVIGFHDNLLDCFAEHLLAVGPNDAREQISLAHPGCTIVCVIAGHVEVVS